VPLTGEVAEVVGRQVRAVAADGQLGHVEGLEVELGHVGEVGSAGELVADVGEVLFCVAGACMVGHRGRQGQGHKGKEGEEGGESSHGYGSCGGIRLLVRLGGVGGRIWWS